MQENMSSGMTCKCMCHKFVPVLLILIGLAFLLQAWGVLSMMFVATAWPILLILIGLQKLFGGSCACCKSK